METPAGCLNHCDCPSQVRADDVPHSRATHAEYSLKPSPTTVHMWSPKGESSARAVHGSMFRSRRANLFQTFPARRNLTPGHEPVSACSPQALRLSKIALGFTPYVRESCTRR
jgi:hypothetical protein